MNNWKTYYVTNDQILSLVALLKDPNYNKKNKIKTEIIKKLSYLVYTKIKGYKNKSYYEDLLQEGKIGILKALEDFDLERGRNFFKFAIWHIQSKIRRSLNWHKRVEKEIFESDFIQNETSVSLEDEIEKVESNFIIKREINRLSKLGRNVITMRFGLENRNYTLSEIGKNFSLSKEYIRQVESKALNKLKFNTNLYFVGE